MPRVERLTSDVLEDINDKSRYNHHRAGVVLVHRFRKRDLPPEVAARSEGREDGEEVYFAFGVDEQSGDLTDFGGGVKKNETTTQSALREFDEETLGTLSMCARDLTFGGHVAVYDRTMAILFLQCHECETYNTVTARFAHGYRRRREAIETALMSRAILEQLVGNESPPIDISGFVRVPPSPEVRSVVWVSARDLYRAVVNGSKIGPGGHVLYRKVREFLAPCIHKLMTEIEPRRSKCSDAPVYTSLPRSTLIEVGT